MVAVTGLLPVFVALNEGMLPTPPAGNPIPGLSLVQVKVLPVPVKLVMGVTCPLV